MNILKLAELTNENNRIEYNSIIFYSTNALINKRCMNRQQIGLKRERTVDGGVSKPFNLKLNGMSMSRNGRLLDEEVYLRSGKMAFFLRYTESSIEPFKDLTNKNALVKRLIAKVGFFITNKQTYRVLTFFRLLC